MDKKIVDGEYRLWLLLSRTLRVILKNRKKELKTYGITPQQYSIMHEITILGNQATVNTIAKRMFLEFQTISAVVNRMENKQLVLRSRGIEDIGVSQLLLTERAEEIYHKSSTRESLNCIFSALSAKEQEIMRDYLKRLLNTSLKHLKKYYEPPFHDFEYYDSFL